MNREALIDLNDILQHPGRKLDIDLGVSLPVEPGLELVEPITGNFKHLALETPYFYKGPAQQNILPSAHAALTLSKKRSLSILMNSSMSSAYPVHMAVEITHGWQAMSLILYSTKILLF
jgi:hypothetical protein